jgi:hypothetical protein
VKAPHETHAPPVPSATLRVSPDFHPQQPLCRTSRPIHLRPKRGYARENQGRRWRVGLIYRGSGGVLNASKARLKRFLLLTDYLGDFLRIFNDFGHPYSKWVLRPFSSLLIPFSLGCRRRRRPQARSVQRGWRNSKRIHSASHAPPVGGGAIRRKRVRAPSSSGAWFVARDRDTKRVKVACRGWGWCEMGGEGGQLPSFGDREPGAVG